MATVKEEEKENSRFFELLRFTIVIFLFTYWGRVNEWMLFLLVTN
jgi:hypothetical protein